MRFSVNGLLHNQFINRWSPRSFRTTPLTNEEILSLFEAARWSPSGFNEQPWRFVYASSDEARAKFTKALNEENAIWAMNAPLLVVVASCKTFSRNQKENPWHEFDAGAAWMSLALQAHYLGYASHAMGGFDAQKISEICNIDLRKYSIHCMVAIGEKESVEMLPESLWDRERPSQRKRLDEIRYKERMLEERYAEQQVSR